MKGGTACAVACALLLLATPLAGAVRVTRIEQIANAVTELDIERARSLLEGVNHDSPALSFERARLAVYQGDCDTAAAILSSPVYAQMGLGISLGQIAERCAGATAAAAIVEDLERGIWVRLQDDRDRVLVPLLAEVAARTREAMAVKLGVRLPSPLRLEIVRDVFSLSALTGLPVEAAETTGTVAVARWGRVTMLSPRALPHGYPWEDTLAHEIVHLALTRGSRDHAPLWLQEGIAKRLETSWRSKRPFDGDPYDAIARTALLAGQSVGIQRIGPSIAMLPSPEAARIAYAEVASFVSYWIDESGAVALSLLLADLRGIGASSADAAMRSVTGYGLEVWEQRWQRHLRTAHESLEPTEEGAASEQGESLDVAGVRQRASMQEAGRRVRLGDLLFERGRFEPAAVEFFRAVEAAPTEAAVRWRSARALLAAGDGERSRQQLGDLDQIRGPHGPWFALRGRFLRDAGASAEAEQSFVLGVSLSPLSEDVACEGYWSPRGRGVEDSGPLPLPEVPERRALCLEARRILRQD